MTDSDQWAREQRDAAQAKEMSKHLIVRDNGVNSILMDSARFTQAQRASQLLARSNVVPQHFQGNAGNCFIAIQLASRLEVDVFMLMQSMYVVHGKPGLEAKLQIALANRHGPFRGPIQWDVKRDQAGKPVACTAHAVHEQTGEVCSATVDAETVKAEGWLDKGGSKWRTMPELMYRYRSASWLIRMYCPDVVMGMHATDELADSQGAILQAEIVDEAAQDAEAKTSTAPEPPSVDRGRDESDVPMEPGKQADPVPAEDGDDETPERGRPAPQMQLDDPTLDQIGQRAAEAGVCPEAWGEWLREAGLVESDRRTHSRSRLDALLAMVRDFETPPSS